MLVNYLYGHDTYVNPNYITRVWRTVNSLKEDGYSYKLRVLGDKEPYSIDKDSYERIVAWIEAQ